MVLYQKQPLRWAKWNKSLKGVFKTLSNIYDRVFLRKQLMANYFCKKKSIIDISLHRNTSEITNVLKLESFIIPTLRKTMQK